MLPDCVIRDLVLSCYTRNPSPQFVLSYSLVHYPSFWGLNANQTWAQITKGISLFIYFATSQESTCVLSSIIRILSFSKLIFEAMASYTFFSRIYMSGFFVNELISTKMRTQVRIWPMVFTLFLNNYPRDKLPFITMNIHKPTKLGQFK